MKQVKTNVNNYLILVSETLKFLTGEQEEFKPLNMKETIVLIALFKHAPCTMQFLEEHIPMAHSTLSKISKSFYLLGYINKERNHNNTRFTNLTVTARGQELRDNLFKHVKQHVEEFGEYE